MKFDSDFVNVGVVILAQSSKLRAMNLAFFPSWTLVCKFS